ncbi:hypothetical protein [Solidesulfovibrio sp. C21]|uniref:hypothetical protein n=1 Tax=Solidesulfovibrio sp. C21 TaxID=3398613 RepID=UPI0039FC9BC5
MLTIKTSRNIRSMRNRNSFRACPMSTGIPPQCTETYRQYLEDNILKDRAARCQLLTRQWRGHRRRCEACANQRRANVGQAMP